MYPVNLLNAIHVLWFRLFICWIELKILRNSLRSGLCKRGSKALLSGASVATKLQYGYHFWLIFELFITKFLMLFLVHAVIRVVLSLNKKKSYLILLQTKRRCIIFPIPVEHWEKWMMLKCWWAERNLNISRNISKIINWLQDKIVFLTVFQALLWFLAH